MKRSLWRNSKLRISVSLIYMLMLTGQVCAEPQAGLFNLHFDTIIKQNIMDELVYEASINQQPTKETLILLRTVRGDLLVLQKDVVRWKLPMPHSNQAIDYKGERFYATNDLPAATYAFDENHLTIEVILPVSSFDKAAINHQEKSISPYQASPSGFFNYDFFAQRTEQKSIVDGNFELDFLMRMALVFGACLCVILTETHKLLD